MTPYTTAVDVYSAAMTTWWVRPKEARAVRKQRDRDRDRNRNDLREREGWKEGEGSRLGERRRD